eukprot:scaffold88574_cov30-Tisochrysis_lutea.AAC.2
MSAAACTIGPPSEVAELARACCSRRRPPGTQERKGLWRGGGEGGELAGVPPAASHHLFPGSG